MCAHKIWISFLKIKMEEKKYIREQDIVLTEEQQKEMDKANADYKAHKKKMHEEMRYKQSLPYNIKVMMAKDRIREFIHECDTRRLNYHVSVGGLDSIVLLCLIRSMGYGPESVPAVSVSGLEDPSIIRIHKKLGVISLKPLKKKEEILEQCGWPVISKKVTNKIKTLQRPSIKNATTRHAIITGECGKQGHFSKNSRMQLPKKYLKLFGGWDEEGAALGYGKPDFLCSDDCCYWLKEKPCDDWAKKNNSVPFLGLMACEGGRRAEALEEHGCNYFGKTVIRSAPFSFFLDNDKLQLALDLNVPVPEIYGDIVRDSEGNLHTTGARRTGCHICGFGIHMEKRPHRFDFLYQRSPRIWDKTMFRLCKNENGELYGWGHVLDYIGVEWRNPEQFLQKQMTFDDFPEIQP